MRQKYYAVYKTTNSLNDKIYIGIHETYDLDDDYLGSGKHLKNAVNKYGPENFKREWLYIFDNKDDQLAKEKELVTEEFCDRKDTYNICEGGFGGGWHYINRTRSDNEKSRIGKLGAIALNELFNNGMLKKHASMQGKKHSDKTISKLREKQSGSNNGMYGKNHSKISKQKMSESNKGSKNSQFGTCWITNGNEIKKIPLEALDSHLEMGYIRGRKLN